MRRSYGRLHVIPKGMAGTSAKKNTAFAESSQTDFAQICANFVTDTPLFCTLSNMNESQAYILFNTIPSVGAATVRAGIRHFGSVVEFATATPEQLLAVRGIGEDRAAAISQAAHNETWKREEERAASCNTRIVTLNEPEYPELLTSIHSPPLALYIAGDATLLSKTCLAMVGTRAPTLYGRDTARLFASRLSMAGLVIVSGLARGIDTEAAEGALQSRGKTIAVIGSGLDKIYPAENRGLAHRICEAGGAVMTEYPFGRNADRQTFPMRNRIIAGLCGGVLCVEAGLRSGTLITADAALEQGRAVMAIPGRISDPSALGCLKLIKSGARLIDCPEDVLEELTSLPSLGHPPSTIPSLAPPPKLPTPDNLTPNEQKLLSCFQDASPKSADELQRSSGIPPGNIPSLLIALEMKCLLRRTPDNLYVRVRS